METFSEYSRLFYVFILLLNICDASKSNHILKGCCKSQAECDEWVDLWKKRAESESSLEFRLEPKNGDCEGQSSKSLFKIVEYHSTNKTLFFQGTNSKGEMTQVVFDQGNNINLRTNTQPGQKLYPSSYCLRKESDTSMYLQICDPDSRDSRDPRDSRPVNWYRKCCPEGQGFGLDADLEADCVNLPANPNRQFPPVDPQMKSTQMKAIVGLVNCSYPNYMSTALSKLHFPRVPYLVLQNSVKYLETYGRNGNQEWKYATDNYCVDRLMLPENLTDNSCNGEQDVLLLCEEPTEINSSDFRILRFVYVVCLGVAMLFLAITGWGQFTLIEKQNIHTWMMQCYILSLFVFYMFLQIIYVDQLYQILTRPWCTIVGIAAHFFGISTFAWLSGINFDLYWTFRSLQPQTTELHRKRRIWYILFATVLPLIVVAISVGLHFNQEDIRETCRSHVTEDSLIYPQYGAELCFLSNSAQLYYFYLPVGALLLVNVLFYLCTSYRLCYLYKRNQTATYEKHKQSCLLVLKLFFVTGTVWILQIVHVLVEAHNRKWYWTVVDVASMLQAIAIFYIFMCKPETLRSLQMKYPIFKRISCHFNGTYRTPTITDRSTDGSTKLSRADSCQRKSRVQEFQVPNEIIQLP